MTKLAISFLIVLSAGSALAGAVIRVEPLPCAWPNGVFDLDIKLQSASPGFEMGGFDFLLKYDSALACLSVTGGTLLDDCGWEYFTFNVSEPYRIRIAAIANLAGEPGNPSCYGGAPGDLATLTLYVADDQSLVGEFLSVQWFWQDCGDNAVSSRLGDTLFVSDNVFHYDGIIEYEITRDEPLPSPYGVPDSCIASPNGPVRAIDFYNGGLHITGPDLYPPTAHCPAPIIVASEPDECGAIVTFQAQATDNCSEVQVGCWPPSGMFFPVGPTTVICQATDIGGNTDICQFYITVLDTTCPVVDCPDSVTVASDSGMCGAVVTFSATATDNCTGVNLTATPPSGSVFQVGTSPVQVVATDQSGNADTCEFVVRVIDQEAPVLVCPGDMTVSNDPDTCGAVVDFNVTASDNCRMVYVAVSHPPGSFFPVGTTLVTQIATDNSGLSDTCAFQVIVADTSRPAIQCPNSIESATDSGQCGAAVDFEITATDNCSGVTVVTEPAAGSVFPIGTTPVTAVAVDVSGNADTCTFDVTVVDSEPPALDCPPVLNVANDSGLCGAVVDFQVDGSDNCPGFTVSVQPEPGSFFPVGTTYVEMAIQDAAGLTDSCRFPVIVTDSSRPDLYCPTGIAVLNDSGAYGAVVEFVVTAGDNCEIVSSSVEPASGSFFTIGTSTVVASAEDGSGNINSCSFSVTVSLNDPDSDGLPDWDDNCPDTYNPDQTDTDLDGIGDSCCCVVRGNVDNIVAFGGAIDVADLTWLVTYLFFEGPPPPCPEQANADGMSVFGGSVDVSDLSYLASYLFLGGPIPPDC